MKHRLMLDSGAPTIYNLFARDKQDDGTYMGSYFKDRKKANYDWLHEEEYLKYREEYIQYILTNKDMLETYINLDIVNNPEATWENQKYLESRGLSPMPVWHLGTDISFLKRYIAEGYEHIGIGGMVPNPYTTLRPALDELFSKVLCDESGMPKIKVHGFAASSIRMMCRYPWYSVDSASWVKYASYGYILIPRRVNGKYKYTTQPHIINVSTKSGRQHKKDKHYVTMTPQLQKYFDEYIEFCGFKKGESHFAYSEKKKRIIEVRDEIGVCNEALERTFMNALYYMRLTEELPKWPWRFRAGGLSLF